MPETWSWLGDHLALDFANTVQLRRDGYVDLVAEDGGWASWMRREVERLPEVSGYEPDVGDTEELTALRDHVLSLLRAAARGDRLPSEAVEAVNRAALAAPMIRVLDGEGRAMTRAAAEAGRGEQVRGLVAAAVVDLVSSPERQRLALCGAPSCGQLYLRRRRDQQWCGNACGDRARGARHHARQVGKQVPSR